MSEVLRELVVALSLDSDNFARNLRTINKQIKEAESTFNLAGAGVDKFEKTIQGTESKLSMLGSKLTQQNRAVEQYSRALVAANQKLTDSYARQERMKVALEDARTEYQRIGQQVTSASEKYKEYARTLGDADSATIAAGQNLDRLKEEHKAAGDAVKKLEGQITANSKTLQNNADAIATATANLNNAKAAVKTTEAEIKKLTEELYRMQSKWTQAGTALTAFSKKCETVSKAMVSAGKGMTAAITTPILALGTAAVKASIDYESAFTSVRKTVDATEEEYAALSSSIKEMSTQVASSGSDIAEVVAVAGQLGIANEHLMDSRLKRLPAQLCPLVFLHRHPHDCAIEAIHCCSQIQLSILTIHLCYIVEQLFHWTLRFKVPLHKILGCFRPWITFRNPLGLSSRHQSVFFAYSINRSVAGFCLL